MTRFDSLRCILIGVALTTAFFMTEGNLSAQDKLVDFKRDIQPIFEKNCLECHGPDLDEAGLNLADPETFIDYHEPGDASSSDLFNVLIDEDRIMPPEDSGEPLSVSEIALVKLWIDEGAEVSEDETGSDSDPQTATADPVEPAPSSVPPHARPLHEKIWSFHGYFHPAVVHFPIALLTVSALFVILHWLFKGNFKEFAFYLLMLGAAGSIVACTKGWAFAPERSLGGGIFDVNHELFRHRWLGVGVAVFTTLLTILAMRARKSDSRMAQFTWQAGVLLAAGLVGIAGHQGGELVYGEGLYDRAFEKYFGEVSMQTEETSAEVAGDSETSVENSETEEEEVSDPSEPQDEPEDNGEGTPANLGDDAESAEAPETTTPENDGSEADGTEDDGENVSELK